MLAEKKPLGVEELEAQTALELPDRELMLVQTGVVNVGLEDVNVGVCANVTVLSQDVDNNCEVRQQ